MPALADRLRPVGGSRSRESRAPRADRPLRALLGVAARFPPAHDRGVPGPVARGDVLAPPAPGVPEGREPLAAVPAPAVGVAEVVLLGHVPGEPPRRRGDPR